ncbi:MAG: hypothetical protein P1U33_08470 [Litorivicinaceae bacterium]|uniref:hypothetical protein n=1 Tax=Thalassovita sp. TaxID=1979401 RepID=UPI0028023D0C|nr:hypothetical protein [Thalassovita sp.]MDF1784181.1 hypothetical protein [Litorivicinaceae bacterium]MDF1803168.1 hypothetical protein [Thalassovita sp.]
MKSNQNICSELLKCVAESDADRIATLSNQHREDIPFVQIPVLYEAFAEFIQTNDATSLRALMGNGFQPFISHNDYSNDDIQLDPPITCLFIEASQSSPSHSVMEFLHQCFSRHLEDYLAKHAGSANGAARDWKDCLLDFRENVFAYMEKPDEYESFLREKETRAEVKRTSTSRLLL